MGEEKIVWFTVRRGGGREPSHILPCCLVSTVSYLTPPYSVSHQQGCHIDFEFIRLFFKIELTGAVQMGRNSISRSAPLSHTCRDTVGGVALAKW